MYRLVDPGRSLCDLLWNWFCITFLCILRPARNASRSDAGVAFSRLLWFRFFHSLSSAASETSCEMSAFTISVGLRSAALSASSSGRGKATLHDYVNKSRLNLVHYG